MELKNMKSFEKYGGWLGIGLTVGVPGYLLYLFLPALIELAKNTVILMALVGVGGVLAMILLSPSTWSTVYYAWAAVLQRVRKAIVKSDPIAILRAVNSRFSKKLDEIDVNIREAIGAYSRQQDAIRAADEKAKNEEKLARAAETVGKPLEQQQHAVAAVRWRKTSEKMRPLCEKLLLMKDALERARDLCAARISDLNSQEEALTLELDTARSSAKALTGFRKFFGDSPELQMQRLAVEQIERETSEAEADLDEFIRVITPALNTHDLQKQADALEAMEQLGTKFLSPAPIDAEIIPSKTPEKTPLMKGKLA